MKKQDEKTIDMVREKGQGQFLKSVQADAGKNCGKTRRLEHSAEPSETKTALERFPKSVKADWDKKRDENKELEYSTLPREAKNVLGRRRKKEQMVLDAAILKAAQEAGKKYGDEGLVSYLEAQAHAAPSGFLTLLGKILAREDEQKAPLITRIELVAPQWDENNKIE